MQIIRPHYFVSYPVRKFREIEADAKEMAEMLDVGGFAGHHEHGLALAHCQVEIESLSFFVVAKQFVESGTFEHRVIMNPKILEAPVYRPMKDADVQIGVPKDFRTPNASECTEGCLSFPHKRSRRINRFDRIFVQYQVVGLFGFKRTVKKWLSGLASQVFQHEFDHCEGRNIFYDGYKN